MTRRLCAAVLCTLAAAAGARAEDACLTRAEVQAHVAALRDHVYEAWTPAPGDPPAEVKLRLVLREDGSLETSEIVTASHSSAAVSALAAIQKASLPPLPEAARCLAGRRLIATFQTPEEPPSPETAGLSRWLPEPRWLMRGVLLLTFALMLPAVWWMTRLRPALDEFDDVPVPSEGALLRSRSAQWLPLAGAAHLPVFAFQDPLWIAFVVLADAFLVFQFFRNRHRPLVRFSSAELAVADELGREKRARTAELSSWAATATLLRLRFVGGELLQVPLAALSKQDTRILLAYLRRLPLVSSSQPPLTGAELQRLQRRRMLLMFAAVFGVAALVTELLPPVSG